MITKYQQSILDYYKQVRVEADSALPGLGYCTLDTGVPKVVVKKDLPIEIRDVVLAHEYGHIFYRHLYYDEAKERDRLRKLIESYPNGKNRVLSDYDCHLVINICMDLQINSTILSISQMNYMAKAGYALCSTERYAAPAGLHYRDYYPYVIADWLESDNSYTEANEQIYNLGNVVCDPDVANDSISGTPDKVPTSSSSSDSDSSPSSGIGSSNSATSIEYITSSKDDLARILKNLVITRTRTSVPDSLRLHNRNCRGQSDLMYSSLKSVTRKSKGKFAFIVDVSGSMRNELIQDICSQLYNLRFDLNPNSKVILWNTSIQGCYSITDLPKLKAGGGTDLSGAVAYAESLGLNDLVFITDMGLSDDKMHHEMSTHKLNYHLIAYDCTDSEVKSMECFKLFTTATFVE